MGASYRPGGVDQHDPSIVGEQLVRARAKGAKLLQAAPPKATKLLQKAKARQSVPAHAKDLAAEVGRLLERLEASQAELNGLRLLRTEVSGKVLLRSTQGA
ncbi:hypothetical protein E2562_021605 [Oryza meyeriana var. granulata]|uniref:Uncharacterized protein n=1 Tax=Oryza meyeriana var. granulata TaxID=110450 RepID=A0A6G1EB95_9ORYZ|nr:hypothetical protein E2562_021605 [Oryza meyeriana var. granulata]